MRGIMALGACALAIGSASAQERPLVDTASGRVEGIAQSKVDVFKGLPYAAPPVGERRWRAPAGVAPWRGVRDAASFGAACPQPAGRDEPWARVGKTSEDCLFLNVWRPKRAGRHPVMVFVHGGGFTYGSAGVPLYDGAKLAARGAVVVTINYRLGLLGFFAHPALTREDPQAALGNYGVMDVIAALRWVHDNAARFGGDPGNVTLFGESAGAGIVQILMGSPAATGLFHKAVSESGAGGAVLPRLAAAEAIGDRLAQSAGLAAATAPRLRAIPVERLLARSFPFVDGRIVTASPGVPFARGREARIPLLIGANSNEATLPSNNEQAARTALGGRYEEFLRRYAAAMPAATPAETATELAEDALSVLPSMSMAAMHAAAGAPAYAYVFDQVPADRRRGSAGSPHGGEIEYLFGNPDEGSRWDDADREVSRRMGDRWVAFARSKTPAVPGTPAWPRVEARGAMRYLAIGVPTRTTALTALREEVRTTSLAASSARWSVEP